MINCGLRHRNEYDGNGDKNFVDAQALAELRQFLRYRSEIAPFTVSQLTYFTLGVEALQQLGTVLRTDAGLNGFYRICWVVENMRIGIMMALPQQPCAAALSQCPNCRVSGRQHSRQRWFKPLAQI